MKQMTKQKRRWFMVSLLTLGTIPVIAKAGSLIRSKAPLLDDNGLYTVSLHDENGAEVAYEGYARLRVADPFQPEHMVFPECTGGYSKITQVRVQGPLGQLMVQLQPRIEIGPHIRPLIKIDREGWKP